MSVFDINFENASRPLFVYFINLFFFYIYSKKPFPPTIAISRSESVPAYWRGLKFSNIFNVRSIHLIEVDLLLVNFQHIKNSLVPIPPKAQKYITDVI